jgi:hydroxymethylglutaryl-CoA lyase
MQTNATERNEMTNAVEIVECPRDAWQGLAAHIPAEAKAAYLRKLIDAGFKHIDAVSFVSPAAVPQMADSEEVLAHLNPPADVEIIGIVVNEKGAERAIRTGRVSTLGFPYSTSSRFLEQNQHQSQHEALVALESIKTRAADSGSAFVCYLSMAFGNPYGDEWSIDRVSRACDELAAIGVRRISLADTVGLATSERIFTTLDHVIAVYREMEVGVHLHARRDQAPAGILAAYEAGCRRFDAALGGFGGCPFAQDELVGNIPTEILLSTLEDHGAEVPKIASPDELVRASEDIAAEV